MITLLIMVIFSIQSIIILKGKFFYCDMTYVPEAVQDQIITKWDCQDYGGDWVNRDLNYDNIWNGMITNFTLMTAEGWVDILWHAVDATEIHQVPERGSNPYLVILFIVQLIVTSLFILNLFVGVVINTFNVEKEKLSHNNLLTSMQLEVCDIQKAIFNSKPDVEIFKVKSKLQSISHKIVQYKHFENFIFICICLNTLILALTWEGQNQTLQATLDFANRVFTIIYTLEAIVKLLALRMDYFRDSWNNFDLFIVIAAWLGTIILEVF